MAEHLINPDDAASDLLACATFVAEGVKSSDGHADAMKAIVPLYLAKADVDMAAELANTVDDPFSRDRLLTAVAEKCAALDDDEYAFQLADAIEDHGLQAQARERIALQKSAKGDFEKAAEIATELHHPDYVFADIAIQRFAKGEFEKAQDVLDGIQFPTAEVFALQAMAAERIRAEDNSKAVELLDDAAEAAGEIEHDEERIRAFAETGNLFIEAKRKDKAVETFDKVRAEAEQLDNLHRDFFLGAAAVGFLQAGSVELADRALDLVKNKSQTSSCLLGYAREYWEREEKDQAVEALDEAYAILKSEKESETRDSRAKYALFTTIAVQYARFEKADRAIEIAQENVNENEQYSGLAQIAQVLELQGKDDAAHQAIKAISDDVNRMFGLIGLSDAADRAGNKEKAVEILREASTMVETIQQLSSRSGAYNELVERFAAHGEPDKAREIALENLEIISQIKDDSVRAVSLARLADVYSEAGFELVDAEKEILGRMAGSAEW
jgi:tetratricopeptide (TPR) repeat protein